MNKHEEYMADFMTVYSTLERWSPGSETETLRALSLLPDAPKSILEIGCGKGLATTILASNTNANITAVDNEESVITQLNEQVEVSSLSSRVTPVCASMTDLPFDKGSFDLIWSEGSAYIMGVTNALSQWKTLLDDDGILMISDMVWLTEDPSKTAMEFWKQEYPDIQPLSTRIAQIEAAGYELLNSFTLSSQAWQNYYEPLKLRVETLLPDMQESSALKDIAKEIDIYTHYLGEFGYQMFILKKN